MTGTLGSALSQPGAFMLGSASASTPPPTPGVPGDQANKFTLGTKESLSVTQQPTLGGRWSW